MKIFIICSKRFYPRIPEIRTELESTGHLITLPNSYDDPAAEERYKNVGVMEHSKWKAEMIRHSANLIIKTHTFLIFNFF